MALVWNGRRRTDTTEEGLNLGDRGGEGRMCWTSPCDSLKYEERERERGGGRDKQIDNLREGKRMKGVKR